MGKSISLFGLITLITCALSSCNLGSAINASGDADTVQISMIEIGDTASFPLITGEKCEVLAKCSVDFPESYINAENTLTLQKLFNNIVLEVEDTLNANDALNKMAANILDQYGVDEQENIEHIDEDYEIVFQYANYTNIRTIYNKSEIISFCKTEETIKNNNSTMKSSHYLNFDLQNMSYIDLNQLFPESTHDVLTELLKKKLIKQLDVETEDDVINLGYFNLDNLRVNNNFYINENGITWNFIPYEISLLSVGETSITLDFDDLQMYMLNTPLTERLLKNN